NMNKEIELSDLTTQINWIKQKFSDEAQKVRSGAKRKISQSYYDRLIENTEKKYASHPNVKDLQVLKFEFDSCGKNYTFEKGCSDIN
ncbi:hypothetical protein ACGLQP_004295, partial [Vibrio vulnificus]